jgi:hypothetical protein
MSTLQHTQQHPVRTRLALVVVLTGAVAALIVALVIASAGGSTSAPSQPHPSQATIDRQLEAVSGARYGITRPGAAPTQSATPQRQLEAVAGARYQQPVGIHATR